MILWFDFGHVPFSGHSVFGQANTIISVLKYGSESERAIFKTYQVGINYAHIINRIIFQKYPLSSKND